ncbi:hypothetical protein ATZ33_05970 [Enterococcus silesiacus]|uniref:Uncharacterized protein n=1 Tax=Enterococcus silesiacus TaxID=332949 RepID=A0A0S3K9K8_9ENTE|nr:hypothetical protein [Enterococcus silesiacus]ALS00930.1 hypothetical protein ATZ33_05970 [Enterococcus silesiacus]OJG89927.1 hypothetical protein RV15_GL001493 [Enterococcus silesiacus]
MMNNLLFASLTPFFLGGVQTTEQPTMDAPTQGYETTIAGSETPTYTEYKFDNFNTGSYSGSYSDDNGKDEKEVENEEGNTQTTINYNYSSDSENYSSSSSTSNGITTSLAVSNGKVIYNGKEVASFDASKAESVQTTDSQVYVNGTLIFDANNG